MGNSGPAICRELGGKLPTYLPTRRYLLTYVWVLFIPSMQVGNDAGNLLLLLAAPIVLTGLGFGWCVSSVLAKRWGGFLHHYLAHGVLYFCVVCDLLKTPPEP